MSKHPAISYWVGLILSAGILTASAVRAEEPPSLGWLKIAGGAKQALNITNRKYPRVKKACWSGRFSQWSLWDQDRKVDLNGNILTVETQEINGGKMTMGCVNFLKPLTTHLIVCGNGDNGYEYCSVEW
jgi:hypothetical protein